LIGDGLAVLAIAMAGVLTVLIMVPAEGFLSAPLHQALGAVLGRSAFLLPVLLILGGVLRLMHVPLPRARMVGLVLLSVTVLASEHLLAWGDAGLVGRILAEAMNGALGSIGSAAALLCGLAAGAILTFGVRLGAK
jgi:hypothetical protein